MRIQSSRLVVDIDEPGESYHRSRFDWTGIIRQVTLDGHHTFCTVESFIPGQGTGGIGLCGEFGIAQPVGYEDSNPGEQFPKLGIGLLTRPDDQAYNYMREYSIEPFEMDWTAKPDEVTFTIAPRECRGYAARLVKRIRVEGNNLFIEYRLENTGQMPIKTSEYNHNFLSIDTRQIGPEYVLHTSVSLACERKPEILSIEGQTVHWNDVPNRPFYCRTELTGDGEPGHWTLIHTPSGVGIREADTFSWSVFALWGTDHVVSPEAFVNIALESGEAQEWQRVYTFFASQD